jgi:deoxycytidylate deaminase
MGAILVKGGSILSVGLNRASPGVLKDKRYIEKAVHAERDAIYGVDPKKLKGATVYVTGITKCGNLLKSEPCSICKAVLSDVGVKAVYYYHKNGEIGVWEP